jgi:hypothetical protein
MQAAPESALIKSEAPKPAEKKIEPIAEVNEDDMAATIVAKKEAGTYLTILEQLYENKNKDLIEEAEQQMNDQEEVKQEEVLDLVDVD